MGLFDRIFTFDRAKRRRQVEEKRPNGNGEHEQDAQAAEAIERHHDAIQDSLEQRELEVAEAAAGLKEDGVPEPYCRAMTTNGDGTAEIIKRLRTHSDPNMRALAAKTLGLVPRDADVILALRHALNDSDETVRKSAREVLQQLGCQIHVG